MVHSVQNKVFLITGGANGLGAYMTKTFILENPKQIVIADLDQNSGLSLQNELNNKYGPNKVKFVKCDVTVEEQLTEAFNTTLKSNGKIDVVINNAGIFNDKAFKKCVEINLTAVINGSLKALDIMRKDRGGNGGTVINIASVAALANLPQCAVYCATKSAVLQFSTCLGSNMHYSRTGVRFMTVCFGPTDTNILNVDKVTSIDEETFQDAKELITDFYLQKADTAVQAVVEAFKYGDSGSTWLIANDQPPENITSKVKKAYAILGENVIIPR